MTPEGAECEKVCSPDYIDTLLESLYEDYLGDHADVMYQEYKDMLEDGYEEDLAELDADLATDTGTDVRLYA